MALTDMQARKAKAREKDYKLADEKGLYLFVSTTGHRSWRMKYRFAGKEKLLTFGAYPELTLSDARDAARRELREERDPGVQKKKRAAERRSYAGDSFETVARAWHGLHKPRWSKSHQAPCA